MLSVNFKERAMLIRSSWSLPRLSHIVFFKRQLQVKMHKISRPLKKDFEPSPVFFELNQLKVH